MEAVVNTTSAGPVVRVAGFWKRYRKHEAVCGVDLEIRPGEIYGLIGPDGSGKSSLMKAIAGVLTFDAGEVEVFGVKLDSEGAAEQIKDRLGFMPQGLGLNLYPELSVEENIDFFAHLRLVSEKDLAERKQRLLAMTRLERFRDRPMKHLSGGMKQKLALVCTLIHEPKLVILDEPTTGVDPVSRRDFWAILAELSRQRGLTALVSTAYLDEATRFHRMSLLFGGRVLAQGAPDEILVLISGSLVALQAKSQVEALARLKAHFPQAEALGPWLRVFVEKADSDAAARQVETALAGIQVHDLYTTEPELEDVFVALLRQRRLVEEDRTATAPSMALTGPPAEDSIAIEALELVRDFDGFRAVDKVSFRIRQGEIFGLLGANGAGKTTVIKMLTGLLPPTAGAGRVAGVDMRRAGQDIKERIGYMSQVFSLYRDLTVIENIHLYAGIYGLSRSATRQRTEWIIGMAGLAGHEANQAGRLPMGVRQRLALGCALVHRPQVLFLDEPTSGVDPVGRRRFWDILFRLSHEEGVAILVTTHSMSEAEHCGHLALMFAGRLVADASPEEMKRQVEAEAGRLLELGTDQPMLAMEQLVRNGFSDVALFGNRIHLLSRQYEKESQRLSEVLSAAGIGLRSLTPRPLSMEDVFVYRVMALERAEG
ncbi:MAG: ABC transporter ATP-binding protein [candidate division NC10 bacterium]|nr:ABC transporter ATP-binding protein [candidate division NC10 bacterium]